MKKVKKVVKKKIAKIVKSKPVKKNLDIIHSLHVDDNAIHGVVEKIVHPYIGKHVVVRTWGAGVHFGILKEFSYINRIAFLEYSRRIWKWEGAFTLSEVAVNGISKKSKLSIESPEIMVSQVEELIPISAKAIKILDDIEPWNIHNEND